MNKEFIAKLIRSIEQIPKAKERICLYLFGILPPKPTIDPNTCLINVEQAYSGEPIKSFRIEKTKTFSDVRATLAKTDIAIYYGHTVDELKDDIFLSDLGDNITLVIRNYKEEELHMQSLVSNKDKWKKYTMNEAAREGYLKCLMYLLENDCPYDNLLYQSAVYGNHLDCLIWFYQNGHKLGFTICELAAYYGSYECLEFLLPKAVSAQTRRCGDYNTPVKSIGVIGSAAKGGDLDALILTRKYEYP